MATDVLLLADVLEKYREMCWSRMQLEALSYISLPSLTFDACMKLTRTKLEIVKDIDMIQMFELGIRGSIILIFFFSNIYTTKQKFIFNVEPGFNHESPTKKNFRFTGGISVISHRHARANNPGIPNFDANLPESYLLYIDANVSSSHHATYLNYIYHFFSY